MIIWGSKGRTTTIACGDFYCPRCGGRRPYEQKKVARYFTLYFIPLFETKNLGEYVECQTCYTPYKPEVLDLPDPTPVQDLIRTVSEQLRGGLPIRTALAGLSKAGLSDEHAARLLYAATKGELKACTQCALLFDARLTYCSNCGSSLTKYDGSK